MGTFSLILRSTITPKIMKGFSIPCNYASDFHYSPLQKRCFPLKIPTICFWNRITSWRTVCYYKCIFKNHWDWIEYETYIGLTMSTTKLISKISNWWVSEIISRNWKFSIHDGEINCCTCSKRIHLDFRIEVHPINCSNQPNNRLILRIELFTKQMETDANFGIRMA